MKNFSNSKERRKYLEKKLNVSLRNISSFSLSENKIKNHNCENMIGAIQVPLGIAGPLVINHQSSTISHQSSTINHQSSIISYYLPLATTEGALVASVNRGCKAARLSSGINVLTEEVGATRGPIFRTKNIKESLRFKKWLDKNFSLLRKQAAKTSSHLLLKKFETWFIGRDVYVRFYFNTSEAMGMNMATIATEAIVQLIKDKLKIKCLSLSGNFGIDKKPSWLNFISGRGKRVWAEAIIKKEIVKKVLKTEVKKIVKVVNKKCLLGSIMAGSLGFNAHYSNIINALFLALGQDLGQAVEGSLGITTAELEENGDLYFSVYLPDLMVGTVGGGTGLETQKEALAILSLNKGKKGDALRLAEIIGAAVLAGELSLISALASGHLAQAHQKLARGIKIKLNND